MAFTTCLDGTSGNIVSSTTTIIGKSAQLSIFHLVLLAAPVSDGRGVRGWRGDRDSRRKGAEMFPREAEGKRRKRVGKETKESACAISSIRPPRDDVFLLLLIPARGHLAFTLTRSFALLAVTGGRSSRPFFSRVSFAASQSAYASRREP